MHARRRSRVIAAVIAVAVLALAVLWLRPAPVPVETARVRRGPLRVTVDAEGMTRVRQRYEVTSPITGRLARLALSEGDSVRAGAVVARIDPTLLDPRGRELAAAELRAAEDAASQARAEMAQARTRAEQAARDLARARQLASARIMAPSDLEGAESIERTRAAELSAATYRVQQLEHDIERARAALEEPGARGTKSLQLRAPASGRVLRIVERDERVVPAGTPVMEIGDPHDLELVVDVLSTDAVRVAPGDSMLIDAWGGDTTLIARVRRVEPSAFTKTSALGIDEQRVNIIGDIANPPPALGDHYRVEARIVVWNAPDVLTVPIGALFRAGDEWSVFVVERGRARRRTVAIGHRGANATEVRAGLTSGEVVILHPSDRIEEGARVRAPEMTNVTMTTRRDDDEQRHAPATPCAG